MIISIAIADKNREYIKRLSEVLQQNNDLNISVFTSSEKLQSALEREKYDIVLFDPDISETKLLISNVKLAVCLYSDEAENGSLYANLDNILKYQRISNIYKEIMKIYAEKAGYSAELNNSHRSEIIGVYSPIGGSGKTLIALALASKLTEYGKSVLYISTEQLSSSSSIFQYTEEGNTALVEAVAGDTVFELKLRGIAKSGLNGIYYVEGFSRIVDYCDVTGDEMGKVLDSIRKCGIYDKIIVDMGSTIDDITKTVIEKSDHIVIANKPGEFAARKMSALVSQGMISANRKKIVKVNNFAENNSKYNEELDVPVIGLIHNYGNLAVQNIIHTINTNKEINVSRFVG